ncbi:hypothetical protein ATE84_2700 [Aquimarina sp. MAR_2010_214]|nr:hypothetical protein ATE84_2700 [Aquimarina sp. MAR_2010_214]
MILVIYFRFYLTNLYKSKADITHILVRRDDVIFIRNYKSRNQDENGVIILRID